MWESARPNPCSTLSTLAGCPTHPSLGNATAVVHKAARVFLPCLSIPRSPILLPALCYPALPLPAHVLHNAPRLLPELSYPAIPCLPAHPIGPCLLPTLSYTAVPCLPRCPQSAISFASCPRFPTLPLLACPQCAMPLLSPTALLLQLKGSLCASRCSNSRSPATSCSAGQGHAARAS